MEKYSIIFILIYEQKKTLNIFITTLKILKIILYYKLDLLK